MGYGERRGGFGGSSGGGSSRGFGGGGGSFGGQTAAPVKVGDELDVKIESVGEKGDGLAKVNNFVIFVPGTKAGDQVRIRITRVLRNVAFAEVVGKSEGGSEPASEGSSEGSSEGGSESSGQFEDTEDFGEENQENQEQ